MIWIFSKIKTARILCVLSMLGIPFSAQGLSAPDHIEAWELGMQSPAGLWDFKGREFIIEGWGHLAATTEEILPETYKDIAPFLPYVAPKIFELSGDGPLEKQISTFQGAHPNFALQIAIFFPIMWNKEIRDPFYLFMGRASKEGDATVRDLSPLGAAVRGLNDIYIAEAEGKKQQPGCLLPLSAPLGEAQVFYFLQNQMDGVGVKLNVTAASRGIRALADIGYLEAALFISDIYFNVNPQVSFNYCKIAADGGIARAQFNLSLWYDAGEGVEKNEAEAIRYTKMAAAAGIARAQFNLGLRHEKGEGVEKNEAEALKYYKFAADQGNLKVGKRLEQMTLAPEASSSGT